MCVIIHRKAGVVIPPEKISSACHVNPDGFGLSVIDRGLIDTRKIYDPKGNNPDIVNKLLEEAIDHDVFLHLRFTTAGAKDPENCHPFQLMTKKDHGYAMMLMHNGTFSDFKDAENKLSDTRMFCDQLVSPLAIKFWKAGVSGDTPLDDPLFVAILEKYTGSYSKLVLYDQDGKVLIVDPGKNGKTFEGWWASNDYSFNRTHRDPVKPKYQSYAGYHRGWEDEYYGSYGACERGTTETQAKETIGTTHSVVQLPPYTANTNKTETKEETKKDRPTNVVNLMQQMGFALNEAKRKGAVYADNANPAQRVTFCDLAELDDLSNVAILDTEELEDLVLEVPEAATILLMDLIYELYVREAHKQKASA